MWKLLRIDKERNVSEEAKTVANRIDHFSNLCEQGKVEDTGREDVLYKALGKKEHGGRVTAVGVGVIISDYFGKLQSKKEYMDQVTKLMLRMNYLERELKKIKKARSEGEDSHSEEEDLEAFNIHDINETNTTKIDIPEGITPCELALSDPSYRFVALGKVHNFSTGTRVHTNSIPNGYVRVNIDYAIEENTPLPIPIEGECYVINDAIGTLVLWPIELVVLEKTAQKVDRSERVVNVDTMLPEMFMFYKCIMKMDCSEQIIIPIDVGITTQSKTVHVGKEEILQFLAHEQIGVCHILIYMTKMYEYASVTGVSSLFGFLCPSDGYVRVNIDYAIEENTPLPIPIEGECYVINDAIGTLVLWPIELVVLEKTVVNSLRNQDEHGDILIKTPLSCDIEAQKVDRSERVVNVDTMLPEMFMFYKCIMKMDCSEQTIIPIDVGITTQSKTVHV
ncbi:Adenine deaminase, partial [Bienertia sinuspersici]